MRIIYSLLTQVNKRRHDTQHNDTQYNDTQHNGLICETQHKWYSANALSITVLSAIMLSVVMLSVVMLSVIILNIVIPSVIMLNVIMPYVVILSVVAPNKLIALENNLKSLFCNELETIKSLQTIFYSFYLI